MRRLLFASFCLACLLLTGIGAANRYQIISERRGWFGLGGKTVIMLDREGGESWELRSGKWVALPKVKVEEEQDKAELKQREKLQELAAQLETITAQQARELSELKAKQEAQLKTLAEGKKALEMMRQSAPAKAGAVAPTRKLSRSTAKTEVASKNAPAAEYVETTEEGPPGWLQN